MTRNLDALIAADDTMLLTMLVDEIEDDDDVAEICGWLSSQQAGAVPRGGPWIAGRHVSYT